MALEVSSNLIEALLGEAEKSGTHECCGLLLGDGDKIVRLCASENVHPEPETHFEIEPQALIDAHRAAREGGPKVLGYYHSHPNGLARPSATDSALAAGDGTIWAIVAAGGVSFWRSGDAGFARLPYEARSR